MKRRGLTYPQIVALIALALVAISAAFYFTASEELATRSERRSTPPPNMFLLPGRGYDITEILLHSRDDVRKVLGPTSEDREALDVFEVGLSLRVRYADGVATALLVGAPGVRKNESAVRHWLHIPPGNPAVIGTRKLVVGPLSDGTDALEIALDTGRVEPPAARHASAAPSGEGPSKVTGHDLLHGFPRLPDFLEKHCIRSGSGPTIEYTCAEGLDSRLVWETDATRSFSVLTLVTVPVGREESACRAFLLSSVDGVGAPVRREDDDQVTAHYKAGALEYLYTWEKKLWAPGTAPCSIMACQPNAQGAGPGCRPAGL